MNKTGKVAVVIPLYKPTLTPYEDISLRQCFKTLSAYDIIAVKPDSLNIAALPGLTFTSVTSFNDDYFKNIHGYNRLMLSHDFYKSFAEYEYILIYQTDAFVFEDELTHWCNMGYDYIGAPWIMEHDFKNVLHKIRTELKTYLYTRYNAKYKNGMPKIGKQMLNKSGNGGFSLRRVKLFTEYTAKYRAAIDKYIAMEHPWFNEDIFWSIELNRKQKAVKIPPLNKALAFAFESHPARALRLNNNKLPFGCHAWDKNTEFWRPYFKQYGFDI